MSAPDPQPSGSPGPDAIRADIAATREELAATVDELSYRLDVPARAKEGVREGIARAKDTAVETYRESPPLTVGAALAVVGLVVALVVRRRRRRTSARRNR